MSDQELWTWAYDTIASDIGGRSHITAAVAPAVLRALGEKGRMEHSIRDLKAGEDRREMMLANLLEQLEDIRERARDE